MFLFGMMVLLQAVAGLRLSMMQGYKSFALKKSSQLFMSDFQRPTSEKVVIVDEELKPKDKTNSDEEEARREISESMRSRLRRELEAQGADPYVSKGPILGNPILLISLLVAVLVIAGGKDVFY
jgi:hypothetical protein